MDIDYFLIAKLFDLYESMCIANGSTYLEYDSKFVDEKGVKMSEKEYFFKHRNEFLRDELLDAFYYDLISGNPMPIPLNRIISYLANSYYIYHYNKSNFLVRFFETHNFASIKRAFVSTENIGIEIIRNYFRYLGNNKAYDKNKERILKTDPSTFEKFYSLYNSAGVKTISDLTRSIIVNLFNHYIATGTSYEDSLNYVWEYFIRDIDPLGELEKMGIKSIPKMFYKKLMLGVIVGDVYEDVCNEPIVKSESYNDRVAKVLPVIISSTGILGIPSDKTTRNKILEHFLLLQDYNDKRKMNRDVTYMEDRIRILKKVNPLYKIDELTF